MPKSASPTTASVSAAISARASNDCPSRQQSDVGGAGQTIAPAYDAIGSGGNRGWTNRRCRWWYSPSLVRRLSPRSIFVAWMVGPLWNERWSVTNTPWTRSGWFSSHESAPGTRARTTSPSAARRSSSPSGSRRNARSVPSALSLRAPTADETISVATGITLPLRRLGSLAPLDRWTEQSFDPLDLLANAFRTGAARSRMCADRTDRVEELGAVRNTVRRPLLGREVAQRALVGLERRDEPADALVCLTEGDAARDECLCDVGREQAVGLRGAAHRVRVERQRGNAAGERGPRGLERVRGVEHRFLVLLQIAVVAERKPVKDRGYGDQVANESSIVTQPSDSSENRATSAARRDRCVAQIDAQARNSCTTSRSLTASIEFSNRASNPSRPAVASWSSLSVDVAIAPAPSGETLARRRHPPNRSRSRTRAHACASR